MTALAQLESVIPAAEALAKGGALVIVIAVAIMLGVAVGMLFRRLMGNFDDLKTVAADYAKASEAHTKALEIHTAALHTIVEESRSNKRSHEALRDWVIQAMTRGVGGMPPPPQSGG